MFSVKGEYSVAGPTICEKISLIVDFKCSPQLFKIEDEWPAFQLYK